MQKAEVNHREDHQVLQKNQIALLKLIPLRKAHLIVAIVLQILQEAIIQVLTAIIIITLLIIPTTTIETMAVFLQEDFTLAEVIDFFTGHFILVPCLAA